MPFSSTAGWIALGLLPLNAVVGLILRRFAKGSFVRRMRPHFILGYATLTFAVLHLALSTGGMAGANGNGIWLATFAMAGLGAQAFSGASLQDPGAYRAPLRRWHVWLFWTVLVLTVLHVVFNAPFS